MTASDKLNVVCLASDFKGVPFLRRAKQLGHHVTLVTKEKHLNDGWSHRDFDEIHSVSNNITAEEYTQKVAWLSRFRRFDRVAPLDEFDVLPAAYVRNHFQIEGQGIESALRFRDKLKMRRTAEAAGVPVPPYTALFNSNDIARYAERVEPPLIMKPRTEVSSFGIRKLKTVDELWTNLAELDGRGTWRDHPSQYLLEKFVAGRVFHVDSVVANGEPVFVGVSHYGTPPLKVTHEGGVFTTQITHYESVERAALLELNHRLINAFGLEDGVAHAEFLHSETTGELFLLEVASRVGGAYIADVLEAASGLNLWAEWASVCLATPDNPYRAPQYNQDYAGVALSLANVEHPDTSNYNDDEIVYRVNRRRHVGLIVKSASFERVESLLNDYSTRFTRDYLAFAPAKEHYDD